MVLFLAIFIAASTPFSPTEEAKRLSITGLVVHVTQSGLILNLDDRPNLYILTNQESPAIGDRVALSCLERYTRFNEPDYFLSDFKVIGHEQVPPPKEVRIEELVEQAVKNERITLLAEIEDYFIDEVDTRFYYLSLKSGPHRIYGAIDRTRTDKTVLDSMLGATVQLTGIIHELRGARSYSGNRIVLETLCQEQIRIPAESDLSKLPTLDSKRFFLPLEIARLPRHKVTGTVLAVWHHSQILVRTTDGRIVGATLRVPAQPPHVGESIVVAGYPATDLFNLFLSGGKWQPSESSTSAESPAKRLQGHELFTDVGGKHSIESSYHGVAVCVSGKVLRGGERELEVDLGRDTIRVYAGEESNGFGTIESGSEIELTGIAILESGFWREGMPFPRISGVSIVTRKDSDIVVLSRPPWWTPVRILFAFVGLSVFIAGLIVWNRILMRLAARRSRELIREQLAKERSELKTDERTRLAIELHDSLSQNLSGLGCQLVATRLVLNADSPARTRLETAERMLQSTRTELKRCLFDLREDLLEDPDFERAVRTTLGTLLGSCQLKLRIHIARSVMDDSVAHAVLSVIRELVSNAIRHGHASKIQVAGSLQYGPGPTMLLVSVRDNGGGFDPKTCAGPDNGHFGLTGVRDRISRIGGVFHIESAPGRTYARFSIPV